MVSRIEQKVWAIKKEAARGTAEADSTGARFLPLTPGSEISPSPNLIDENRVFGDPQTRPSSNGPRQWSGTLELVPGTDHIGELLNSLFGTVATDQPDAINAPNVYRHKFTPGSSPQHDLYTVFADRDAHEKKYAGVMSNQMTFDFPVDGRVATTADVMAIAENAGEALTPSFANTLDPLLFSDVLVDVAAVSPSPIVRAAQVVLGNGAVEKRILQQTRDAADLVAGPFTVSGSMTLYFEDDVERDKLVSGLPSSLKITVQGEVLEDVQKATLGIDLPHVQWESGPVGEQDGILVLDLAFRATKRAADPYQAQVTLINKETGY